MAGSSPTLHPRWDHSWYSSQSWQKTLLAKAATCLSTPKPGAGILPNFLETGPTNSTSVLSGLGLNLFTLIQPFPSAKPFQR